MSRGASTGDKFNGTIDKNVEGDNAATKSDGPVHVSPVSPEGCVAGLELIVRQKLASGSSGKSTGDKAEETVDKAKVSFATPLISCLWGA